MRPPRHRLPAAGLAACLALLAAAGAVCADDHPPTVFAPPWDALVGRWEGVIADRGAPEGVAARETATIGYELDGRVLTLRQVSDVPAMQGRPPLHHEELMEIYPAPDGRNAEAMDFDSEGHVVHYAATWSSDERTVVFLSFPEDRAPRMKLTWQFVDADTLERRVEVAPNGSVAFKGYPAGVLRRQRLVPGAGAASQPAR